MTQPGSTLFKLGPGIVVDPPRNMIERDGQAASVEPRLMELLLYLAERPGQIISKRQLMEEVWRANVVDEAIHRAVSMLRSALGDSPQASKIIETVPRQGYRLAVAPVQIAVGRRRYLAALLVAGAIAAAILTISLLPGADQDGRERPEVHSSKPPTPETRLAPVAPAAPQSRQAPKSIAPRAPEAPTPVATQRP